MRYVAETMFKADLINLQRIFPLKQIQIIDEDVFSFECEDENSHIINDLVDNPAILSVYTESSYLKLNKNASLSKSTNAMKLLWYGRCDEFELEHGDVIDLNSNKDTLFEVWKQTDVNKNFVSWNAKIHPSVVQPFSTIKEGNLFFVKLDKNTTLQIKGLKDTNPTEMLGLSTCDYNAIIPSSEMKNEYNLIWYGECGKDTTNIINLSLIPNILEVYQFSENGNAINGAYFANDSSKSTISKLKYGNGYFVRLKKNTTQKIEGCIVSDHVVLNTFAPTHPIRLKDCGILESTPTPEPPATPFGSVCCSDDDVKLEMVNADVSVTQNYVTAMGQVGTMCWEEIEQAGTPSHFVCWLETIGDLNKAMSISSSGDISNRIFRFISSDGICYETKLTSETENIFRKLGEVEQPTPTPVEEPEETPTPVPQPDPTPTPKPNDVELTPTPKPQTTCCESDSGILITKGMSDVTNPTGPSGATISGFEEGGVLCLGTMTTESESISCVFKSEDDTIGGLITLSFKLVDSNIVYQSTTGKCYTGTIANTIAEPQILTEV